MHYAFYLVALVFMVAVVEAADSVKITNAELIKKLQNDLKEKGNTCTSGSKDTLVIDGCTYTVYCNILGEKFFWAKASLKPGGPFWEYKVHLTPPGKLEYLNAVGYSDNNYSDEGTTVYLQDGRPAAVQTPPPSDAAIPSKARGIRVTIADLTYKMQNELKEKGNSCSQTFADTLHIGGATFDVKCGYLRQKYFKAEAGLDDVTFQPFTIYLTDSGRITFTRPAGLVDQKYSNEATAVYLKDPQPIEQLRVKHNEIVHALMNLDPIGVACKNALEYPLIIGVFSFKVECSKYFLKYFEAYAKASENEPFKKYSIKLTAGQTLIFVDSAGDVNSELSSAGQDIYLKANYVERVDVFSYKGTSAVSTANAIKERPEFIKAKLRDIPKRAGCSSERLVNDFEHGRYVFRLYCDHIGRKNFRAMLAFKEGDIMNLATIYLDANGLLISTLDEGRDLLNEPFIYLLEEPLH